MAKALAASRADQDLVVCNLLHALSLGYLCEYSLENATATCKQALQGKIGLLKKQNSDTRDYNEALGLFATIYDFREDYIRA